MTELDPPPAIDVWLIGWLTSRAERVPREAVAASLCDGVAGYLERWPAQRLWLPAHLEPYAPPLPAAVEFGPDGQRVTVTGR